MRSLLLAGAFVASAFVFSAPASAQYYGQPGYGNLPPQAYIDPGRAARNYDKLSRKQAEYYAKYGYPQRGPRYAPRYAPAPQYAPRYVQRPRRYVDPYDAPPAPRYYQPAPRYYPY